MRARLAALVLLVGSCSGGPAVERVEPDRPVVAPVVIGDRWVAADEVTEPGDRPPLTSADGRRWAPARLPGLGADVDVGIPRATGALVVVVAKGAHRGTDLDGPLPPAFAWVTADGATWRGGQVTEHLWAAVAVVDAGGLVLAGAPDEGGFRLWRLAGGRWAPAAVDLPVPARTQLGLHDAWHQADGWRALVDRVGEGGTRDWVLLASTDGGAWHEVPCPGACDHEVRAGRLHLRHGESSFDGVTWQPIEVTGTPLPGFSEVVAVGDGWLATTSSDFDSGSVGRLLASSDGRTWRDLDVGRCARHELRSVYSLTVIQGRAHAVRSCAEELGPVRSTLVEVDGDAVRPRHRWAAWVGELRVVGDRAVVAVFGPGGRVRSFDFVRL